MRLLTTAVTAAALVLAAASPASAAWTPMTPSPVVETFARPTGTTMAIAGRGYGHGHGLSQWGAYGAATRGLTWRQIISFYYPGTTIAAQGNPQMAVRLSTLGTTGTTLVTRPGLRLSDGTGSIALPTQTATGVPVDRWRLTTAGGGLTLQWRVSGVWSSSSYWKNWTRSPLTFSSSFGALLTERPTLTQRWYRGAIRTHVSGTVATPVNLVAMETYLRSVVPSEMPASWTPAAVQSQAVAARTYAAFDKADGGSTIYDTCDTTACQVYSGASDYTASGTLIANHEDPRSDAAVVATAGSIVSYLGRPAFTQFSAANGGVTQDGGQPYLVTKADPYDGVVPSFGATINPTSWATSIPLASIERAFPTIGTLRAIEVPARTGYGVWGGRMTSVRVVGSLATVSTTGAGFRAALGLRSEWWTMTSAPAASTRTFPKDLSSDSLPDLLGLTSGGSLDVLRYTGSMGFTTVRATTGFAGMGLVSAVGTWDSDNRGDVVARSSDGYLWLYRGGSGPLTQGRVLLGGGWNARNLIIPTGDFDGDRHTDFLSRTTTGGLMLYSGNGAGGFLSARTIGSGWGIYRQVFSPGDFDGDGRPDVIGIRASDGRMVLYSGAAGGGLTNARLVGSWDWRSMTTSWGVGDLTGDGKNDIVSRRVSDGALLIYPGTGTGQALVPIVVGTQWAFYTRWGQ